MRCSEVSGAKCLGARGVIVQPRVAEGGLKVPGVCGMYSRRAQVAAVLRGPCRAVRKKDQECKSMRGGRNS
jgi:hypothetical protein